MLFDPLYIMILAATGLMGFWASWRVKRTFKHWSQIRNYSGRTGADIAREILRRSGITDVKVEKVGGVLSDHYDPRHKVLRLSPDVYDGVSVSAAGVAAHEVGHALQHAQRYWPLQVRSYMAPLAALGSNLSMIIFMIGAIVGAFGLVKIGIALFALMVVFTLITLPVEFDASNRAKRLLPEMGMTSGGDGQGVSAVLNAAAWTYVAAAVAAIAQLVYLIVRSGLLGRSND
ncbi:MAG: zinc metallopeptidase [Deltaproteobacteria bacterium]|nr:zinc metallopeptidase [Deltaproteobacteria bacterium]